MLILRQNLDHLPTKKILKESRKNLIIQKKEQKKKITTA